MTTTGPIRVCSLLEWRSVGLLVAAAALFGSVQAMAVQDETASAPQAPRLSSIPPPPSAPKARIPVQLASAITPAEPLIVLPDWDTQDNGGQQEPVFPYQLPPLAPLPPQWTELAQIELQASSTAIFEGQQQLNVELSEVVAALLQSSFRFRQLQVLPTISRQEINEELGRFDPAAFVSSALDVQNLQQKTENNDVRFGVRSQRITGGAVELSQGFGVQDNAIGINALDQGTSSLNLIFSQEVLRDGGRVVVLSRGLAASYRFDQQVANSLAEANLLIEQALQAYWRLYQARGRYFVVLALVQWAEQLTAQIEERSRLVERATNSLEQARALGLEAKAELVDAETRVLQAQDALYRIVNDPRFDPLVVEIITSDPPTAMLGGLSPANELSVAFSARPEVLERLAEIRVAALEREVAINQLLPRLSLSLRSSLNGFDDGRDFGGAFSNLGQRPASAAAGANFEFFTTNRLARARSKRAELGLVRAQLEYEDQLQQIRQEVLAAIRVVNNAQPKIELRQRTLEARQREIDAIAFKTWISPDEGVSVVGQLEQLFQAINRLVRTQQEVIDAKIELQASALQLLRAKGILASRESIPIDLSVPTPIQLSRERLERRETLRDEIRDRVLSEPLPGTN
jgi:outer membrane protein TolC